MRSETPSSGSRRPDPELRIVVVEDDAAILKMIERQLVFRGAKVTAITSPFQLASVLAQERPTVVVLDVTMPGLDGGKLWESGRDIVRPRPGVIFYSALGPAPLAALTARFPEAEGLSKPATSDALWTAVERAHQRAR